MYKAPPPVRSRKRRPGPLKQPAEITPFRLILIVLISIPLGYAFINAVMVWGLTR